MASSYLVLFSLLLATSAHVPAPRYKLRKVLIFSRHAIRTPVATALNEITPKCWPEFEEEPGYLTAKGAMVEGQMGVFFSEWLQKEGLLTGDCPDESMFHAYANIKQRTKASARAFVEHAFPGCNVTVHHKNKYPDPVFAPILHNTTEAFKEAAVISMKGRLHALKLTDALNDLSSILDFSNSKKCLEDHECDFAVDKNKISIDKDKTSVKGPLKYGNEAVDAFVMAYFQGFPTEEVAWGSMSPERWHELIRIMRGYHDVVFNDTAIAKDISKNLIQYIKTRLLNKSSAVTLLMGHDANFYTFLPTLGIKYYELQDQLENIPPGGKIVFQKWYDVIEEKELLKINFVYQSSHQLRKGSKLSLAYPPRSILLEINGCEVDSKGFCPWEDFARALNAIEFNSS
ncbi:hypothetical protein JYU34_021722 [Plutella xylostella]|uniref:Glucose-1-phosphatase n=1 Tax=Plutella xylostella TaxID=51655 RepID=A0ABQ7PRB0_PLUXY|nr:hypothetical protein JYU34_021722 [Plutella xylostella]